MEEVVSDNNGTLLIRAKIVNERLPGNTYVLTLVASGMSGKGTGK